MKEVDWLSCTDPQRMRAFRAGSRGMDEAAWLACTDARQMMQSLSLGASRRKLLLLACACCRRAWADIVGAQGREWVETAERWVDESPGDEGLERASAGLVEILSPMVGTYYAQEQPGAAPYVTVGLHLTPTDVVCLIEAMKIFNEIQADCTGVVAEVLSRDRQLVEYGTILFRVVPTVPAEGRRPDEGHADAVRDIFGNPFRSVSFDPNWLRWRDGIVIQLARAAYEDRRLPAGLLDNARLGIVADALEEAGCHDDQILGHLRSGGEHVRGCFVIDLLLGRM